MQNVLITGAAGGIGTRLRQTLAGVYPKLRLFDLRPIPDVRAGEEVVQGDLADPMQVERALTGIDGVIHLGGISVEDSWEKILPANISGTYNLYEGARRQRVKRVVFASTNHVMGFYRRMETVDADRRVRPDSRYGASKAFGEAIGSLYADKHGIGVLNIRIGNFADRPIDKRRLSIWISPRDLTQLVRIGLEHPDIRCEIVYGMSDNARAWWRDPVARRLGYKPQDKAVDYTSEAMAAEAKLPPDPIGDLYQGGTFCSAEYSSALPRS
jgi:uronate dehydrogenase